MSLTAEERTKRKAEKRRKLLARLRKAVRKDLKILDRIIKGDKREQG
jgi:hypothetical protein